MKAAYEECKTMSDDNLVSWLYTVMTLAKNYKLTYQ